MKRYGLLILIAAVGCAPKYESGKTQCSDKKECPDGFSCSDDGTTGVHYCIDNKNFSPPCPDTSKFYCSQSKTCWAKPGACSTVTYCGTAKHTGYVICASLGYHPDCNGDSCLPNGAVPDAGTVASKGGVGGSTLGAGGAAGAGGFRDAGILGTGGFRDAGILGTGGFRDAGIPGTGGVSTGVRDAGMIGTGGMVALGGAVGRGGTTGTAGAGGGISGTLCSGTSMTCSERTDQGECQVGTGCTWIAATETCAGTAASCSTYTTGTTCIINSCTWSGALTCNKTPISTLCSNMLSDTSVDTPCDVCMYSSCCGQMTNCVNDTTCNTTMSGPLWNAYLDCVTNCCVSSCSF